jgi:membrane-associated protease RseP (regulator of RpoE activity)
MKLKVIGSIIGVLVAVGLIGAGTILAQTALPTATPPSASTDSQGAVVTNTTGTALCDQYLQALAGHLGVTVEKLTQAGKDAAKDMIDLAVKNGRLTADQATAAKQRIDQAQGACGGFGGFGRGFDGRGGPGFPGGPGFQGGPKNKQGGPRGGKVITGTRPFTGTRTFDGATLTQVVADSPAAKAGLQVGDIILAIGGQNIDNQHLLDALIRMKKPGDAVDVKYQHGSDTKTVSVTLGAQPNNAAVPYLGVQFEYRRSAS